MQDTMCIISSYSEMLFAATPTILSPDVIGKKEEKMKRRIGKDRIGWDSIG